MAAPSDTLATSSLRGGSNRWMYPTGAPVTGSLPPATAQAAIPSIPTGAPHLAPPSVATPGALNVDLHQCIGESMPLLKSAWKPVCSFFEEAVGETSKPPEVSELMLSMMDVQLAL